MAPSLKISNTRFDLDVRLIIEVFQVMINFL